MALPRKPARKQMNNNKGASKARITTMEEENIEIWRQRVIEGRKGVDIAADYGITSGRVSQIVAEQWAKIPDSFRATTRMEILYELIAQKEVFHEQAMRGDPEAQKAHDRITTYLREMLDLDTRRHSRSGSDKGAARSVNFFTADGTPIPEDDPRFIRLRQEILNRAIGE